MIEKHIHTAQKLVFILSIFFACDAWSINQGNIELRPYLINQYDLQNQTWSISQNPENHFVYLANSKGLLEYTGIKWQKYAMKDDLPLRTVKVHPQGQIFTGAFEEFGYWEQNDQQQLVYQSLKHHTEIKKNDEIWKIYFHNNEVYFQSFTTIYIYDFKEVRQVTAQWTMLFMHQVNDRFITQILQNGLFWFADDRFTFIENSEIFSNKKVHAIIPYDTNKWLVCTEKEGIFIYDGRQFSYFNSDASDFLKLYTCNAAKQLNDSTFVFGSILNGIIFTDQYGMIQDDYNISSGLNNNTVLALYEDMDGGLWIGLDVGINYIDLQSPFTHYQSRDGTLGTIYALLKKDNHLYIGTNHGLFKADIVKRAHTYYFSNVKIIPDSYGQVWTLEEFDGQIICGHNDGTFLLKNDKLLNISSVTGGWVYRRFGDYLIAGTYTGIIVFEKDAAGNWRFRNKISGFSEPTRHLETDYLGYIWASHHQTGIYQIELSDDLRSVNNIRHFPGINDRSFNIKAFKINNRVIFATSEDIYTFDFVRNEIGQFNILTDYLLDFKTASQILLYKDNQYWFITQNKIGLFNIEMDFSATKIIEVFHENIQMPQRSIQLASMDVNTILIPNPKSFNAYNISLGNEKKDISRLSLEKILFYGNKDSLMVSKPTTKIKTPWNRNNLMVFFTDPSNFDQPNRTYQYRIRQLEPSWLSTTLNHFTFLNLEYGTYTLEIRQSPANTIEIEFTVTKPWFYSNLALLIYVVIFLLIVWAMYSFIRFEIRRHKEIVSLEIKQSNLESELDYKSHELMLTMRHMIMKDEILNDLQKQINTVKDQSSKYPVKHINNMERILNRGLGLNNAEWESAIQNLKLSQQGFFKFLKERYPELTPNDLRLCSFLRLNFNSKEIARLLNITIRGVETNRHRLRKKMGLGKKQNLTEFLMDLDWEHEPSE